jgi:ABC-2 type transport system ATP-binding protein
MKSPGASEAASASGAAPVVVARGLTRRFGDKVAVDGLDLEVGRGELCALLGHNGAGKTTTLRMLAGVLAPSAGEARVFGLSPVEDGPAVRSRLGVLPEHHGLEERLTARQNLRYAAELYGYPEERLAGRVEEMLERFGLLDVGDEKAGGFSRGMKQRLALARALLHEPELLFLDEPTAGLDPIASRQVTETLRELSAGGGRTALICTHDLTLAQRVCDRVVVMRRGRLVALGSPRELAERLPHGRLLLGVGEGQVEMAAQVVRGVAPEAAAEPSPDGAGELLVTRLPAGATPALVAALVGAGVDVHRVEPAQATLEDVYFGLYGEAA